MFDEALDHIIRISRGIYQPESHFMIIGIGGSGKQTLSTLSSYLLSYEVFKLSYSKNYNIDNFHEDLKKMMQKAAFRSEKTSFLFTDSEMLQESFVEDVNSLINSGEVFGIFTEDEVEEIINFMRDEVVNKMKMSDTKETIYAEFVTRVRHNLHIVVCTSPVGSVLRDRCRMFPALVNCCTLDWIDNWPEEALLTVASSKLIDLSVPVKNLSSLASFIHLSCQKTSELYYSQLKRVAFVTPKVFFDFLSLFSYLLCKITTQKQSTKAKLTNGLQKLNETRRLIADLQITLQKMIPDLEIQKQKAEIYYSEVQKETLAAVELHELIEKETEFIEIQAQDCRVRAMDAEKDLAEAMPVLETAIKAVQGLEKNKKDIRIHIIRPGFRV